MTHALLPVTFVTRVRTSPAFKFQLFSWHWMNWSWSSFIAYRVTGNRITTALLSHGSQHVPQQFTFTALLQGFQKLFSGFSSVSFFDAGLTKSRLWPLEVCSEILASMMLLYDLYVLLLAHAHLYVILPSFLHVAALAQTCPWTHGKCTLTKLWDIWTGRQYQIVPTHSILFHRGQHFPTSSSALALAAASACFCSSMDEKFWPGFRIFLWPYRLETCFWHYIAEVHWNAVRLSFASTWIAALCT